MIGEEQHDEPALWGIPKPEHADERPITIDLAFYNPLTGAPDSFTIEASIFVTLWQTAQTVGMERTQRMLGFVMGLSSEAPASEDAIKRLYFVLQAVKAWRSHDDTVLRISYALLQHRQITRKEAAQFASGVLGKKIEDEAWRKRVDRWAKDVAHLPQVGKPRPKRGSV